MTMIEYWLSVNQNAFMSAYAAGSKQMAAFSLQHADSSRLHSVAVLDGSYQ